MRGLGHRAGPHLEEQLDAVQGGGGGAGNRTRCAARHKHPAGSEGRMHGKALQHVYTGTCCRK